MIRQRAVFLTPRLKNENLNPNMEQSLFEVRASTMKNRKSHKEMSSWKNKIVVQSNMTINTTNNQRHRNHLSIGKKCKNPSFIKLITFTVTIIFASILTKSDTIDSVRAEAQQASLFSHPIYLSSSSTRMFASSPTSSILKRDLSARQELTTSSMAINKNLIRQVDGK